MSECVGKHRYRGSGTNNLRQVLLHHSFENNPVWQLLKWADVLAGGHSRLKITGTAVGVGVDTDIRGMNESEVNPKLNGVESHQKGDGDS